MNSGVCFVLVALVLVCNIEARHPVMKLTPQLKELVTKHAYTKHIGVKQIIDPSLPVNFDGRTQWPDQGDCGSCWSFALSCEEENLGCALGSLPFFAWRYMKNYGVVTLACDPYVSGDGEVPACTESVCADGTSGTLYFASNYTQVGSFIEPSEHTSAIMTALTAGPVDATFNVYSDFDSYSGGVYQHTSGTYEGMHSVKVIGWGVENGTDYWLVQNSWGDWGPYGGYFKIRKGVDECSFESLMYTGFPKL